MVSPNPRSSQHIPTLLVIIRGFIWDIPILIFAYVLCAGPIYSDARAQVTVAAVRQEAGGLMLRRKS